MTTMMTTQPMTEGFTDADAPLTEDTAFLLTDAGRECLQENHADEDDQADTFLPDSPEKADWVLSKIADARSRAARIREHAEIMAKQAEAEATFFEWKYGAALQDFARRALTSGKRKSLTLFHGVIGFRTKPAGVQIGDSRAALSWAKENLPDAVTETIDRAAVSKALLTTGEAVPFASFTLPEETFYIK